MLNTVSSISDFITFIYILLQRFSSALLCCCPSLRKTKTDENLSHLDKAIIWAREQPVSWITLCRYVLIGIQVAIEGIISVFETDNLYKRIAIVLNSSGQRVRTFKSDDPGCCTHSLVLLDPCPERRIDLAANK